MSKEEDERAISLQEFAADLARRRAEYEVKHGRSVDDDMPRNSGERRTESKRALLKAIEEAGGKW